MSQRYALSSYALACALLRERGRGAILTREFSTSAWRLEVLATSRLTSCVCSGAVLFAG